MKALGCVVLLAAFWSATCAIPAHGSPAGTKIGFVSLDSAHRQKLSGLLYLPTDTAKPVPAVVMIHGTGGIDQRGELYREPLLGAGIAIFEVDFKTGVYSGVFDRPKPDAMLPMTFAALKELRRQPGIDPHRIGVMGFSMGGHQALRAAVAGNVHRWLGDDEGFAAFAAFYPVCKPFIRDFGGSGGKLTGRPMIIFYGTDDCYGEGTAVPELKQLLATQCQFDVTTVAYPGAAHGFNRNAPAMRYFDPVAKGRRGYVAWDAEAAKDSVTRVVAFLRDNLPAK
jgi:dienelactone hydrolase